MKDEDINVFARNFLAVIAGVIAAVGAGAILYPLVKIIFDEFFHLYLFSTPPSDVWKDDLIILFTMIIWLFIASAAGGFICTLISIDREQVYALISSLVCLTILYVIPQLRVFEPTDWQAWVLLITIPLGNSFGSWLGSKFKRKRRKAV
ncbi:MAG: hypothetical protein WDN26_09875 [Chitinophagaceae bacterium]